jgi:YegS/Rv2252/BmrU family lipid kinase
MQVICRNVLQRGFPYMKKRVLLLMNSISGKASGRREFFPIVSDLAKDGCEVTVYPIIPGTELTSENIIHERGRDFDVIACCGGDGTLNHVINAIMAEGLRTPIGYLPTGSTNDFSKNLHGSLETADLCRGIAYGVPYSYDIGSLNGRYFNYVAGFGAFTKISYDTDQDAKNIFGYGAYIMNAIGSLSKNMAYHVHATVEYDGGNEEGNYIFCGVTNSLQIAGVKSPVLGRPELNDGLFEVLLITAPRDLREINGIIQAITNGDPKNKYIRTIHTSHVIFRTEHPVDWTIDGEFGGEFETSEICVHKQAVSVMIEPPDQVTGPQN